MPNELVLTILVPNHHAKFGDDRLRIADARVVTDGHRHTRTHILLVYISPACYTLHSIAMREKNNSKIRCMNNGHDCVVCQY